MYDIYAYFDFNIGYFTVATKIVDSRYLTSVLAAAYDSFSLSDGPYNNAYSSVFEMQSVASLRDDGLTGVRKK